MYCITNVPLCLSIAPTFEFQLGDVYEQQVHKLSQIPTGNIDILPYATIIFLLPLLQTSKGEFIYFQFTK